MGTTTTPEQPPEFDLTPVTSSRIFAIGYHPESQTLGIRFKRKDGPGPLYHYAGFPAPMFENFLAAESKGAFFSTHIKDAVKTHPFTKVDEAPKDAS